MKDSYPSTISARWYDKSINEMKSGSLREKSIAFSEGVMLDALNLGGMIGLIHGIGLGSEQDEILEGLEQSIERVRISDLNAKDCTLEQYSQICRANNYVMTEFGVDYIKRWIQYNFLFGEKLEFESDLRNVLTAHTDLFR